MNPYTVFSQKLHAFIADQRNMHDRGIVLNADTWWAKRTDKKVTDAAFRLISGCCRKEFITLWGLLDERGFCLDCIDNLSIRASSILERTNYRAIVSTTPTCNYLMQEMHSRITSRSMHGAGDLAFMRNEELDIHYLGPHPVQSLQIEALRDPTDLSVLILTDVIATGSLAFELVKAIQQMGGQVAGILCVFMTNRQLASKIDEEGRIDLKAINNALPDGKKFPCDIPIYCLATYPIDNLNDGQFSKDRLIDIDPLSLLPEEILIDKHIAVRPSFGFVDMFRHLEREKALDTGYFFLEQRRFISAVRINRLLSTASNSSGKEIWQEIREKLAFDEDTVLVAPVNRIDMRFSDFIAECLHEERNLRLKQVLIPKRDAVGSSHYDYFAPPYCVDDLTNRRIILVVASVHTSEKLRKLVTILVRHGVKEINVICLLNRMGRQTAEFIGRIHDFIGGVHGGVQFHFNAVYGLPELRSEDIVRMQETTLRRLAERAKATPVINFKRLVVEFSKYFKSRPVTSYQFQAKIPDPLLTAPQTFLIDGQKVTVHSQQGKLFALCCDLIVSQRRSYLRIIDELIETDDKGTRFFLLGVVLSNLQYLHVIGEHHMLRNRIVERLRSIRSNRLALETSKSTWTLANDDIDEIRKNVDLEVQYMFCLAQICFLDIKFDYVDFAKESLYCGVDPAGFKFTPQNLIAYFTDDRVVWCISLLLHFSRSCLKPNDRCSEIHNIVDCVKRIIFQIEQLIRDIDEIPEKRDKFAAEFLAAKSTLQLLLSDLGQFQMPLIGKVIRYLHKELVIPRKRHNPIDTTLTKVTGELIKLMESPLGVRIAEARIIKQKFALKAWCDNDEAKTLKLRDWLEKGRRTAAMLEEIAEAAIQLFDHATISRQDAEVFAVESGKSNFLDLVRSLGDIISNVRRDNLLSFEEIRTADKIWGQISEAIWGDYSPLHKVLSWYATDIRAILIEEMTNSNEDLAKLGYRNVWDKEIEKQKNIFERAPALIDALLIREVLRNLLRNVRHSFTDIGCQESEIWSDRVSVSLTEAKWEECLDRERNAGNRISVDEFDDFYQLIIESTGKTYIGKTSETFHQEKGGPSTLAQHNQYIINLGGELTVRSFNENGRDGTRAILYLHTRRRVYKRIHDNR